VNRGFFSQRNLAIVFGVVLLVMVVIVGVAVGVGHPSVPSDDVAVIDDSSIDVPGLVDGGHISKTNFNRFLLQTAKQSGAQSVPDPSSPTYKQIKDQAMQTALQIGWIVGEANKEGISFTDTEVQQALQQIKSQFKTEAEYVKARDQAGLTDADVLERARLQVIQTKIQDRINNNVSTPSDSDAKDFYDANKSQFTQPAQRTIRIIQNSDAAKANAAYQALQADHSPATWKKVAAQYSTDPTSKDKGGLRTGVVPGSFQQPVDDDIFNAATGQVHAPVTASTGTYVFEVVSATPEKVLGFGDTAGTAAGGSATVGGQIKAQLKSQAQQDALTAFGTDFRDYWTNLTQCGSDYLVQGCDNFNGGGPTCDPAKLAPSQTGASQSQGCPAPVFSTCQEAGGQLQCVGSGPAPGAPGSFKPFLSATGGAPQGPHPAGAGTAPSPGGITFPGAGGAQVPPGG
jgi:parvulin-like peptidyl-prolyl cis-trans isomerase-like protein/SurA-like protein